MTASSRVRIRARGAALAVGWLLGCQAEGAAVGPVLPPQPSAEAAPQSRATTVSTDVAPAPPRTVAPELRWVPCEFRDPTAGRSDCARFRPSLQGSNREEVWLAVAIHRGTRRDSPLLELQGGPGGRAPIGPDAPLWIPRGDGRDVILVDTRGVGESSPRLACPEFDDAVRSAYAQSLDATGDERLFAQGIEACRERLIAEGHDLSLLSTAVTVRDLIELAEQLGIREWNVYGVSYGSGLAAELMRARPDLVSAAVLDSYDPPERSNLAREPQTRDRALRILYGGVGPRGATVPGSERESRSMGPGSRDGLRALERQLEALRRTPDRAVISADARAARAQGIPAGSHGVVGTESRFVEALLVLASDRFQQQELRSRLPWVPVLPPGFAASLVAEAFRWLHLPRGQFSWPVLFATTCNDEPESSSADLEGEWRRYPLVARWYTGSSHGTCAGWRARPAPFPAAARPSPVRVLFLSSPDDAVTLPEWTDEALALYPNARIYRSATSAHGVLHSDRCAERRMQRFLDGDRQPEVPC